MRRESVTPRPGWQGKLEQLGFDYYVLDGKAYWTEHACYAFTSDQIDELEAATAELRLDACMKQVEPTVLLSVVDDSGEVLANMKLIAARCRVVSQCDVFFCHG